MKVQIKHAGTRGMALSVAAACAAAWPARAAEHASSRQEATGVTTGLALGALAGGPFGAVLGAAAGAWLGDRYHRQTEANAALAAGLARDGIERRKLNTTLGEMQVQGDRLVKLLERGSDLQTQVIFRTGDAALSASSLEQLKKLGALARMMPNVQVRVSGYADPRGTEEFNATLSQQRAQGVAAVLAGEGVDASRLIVEAHGESAVNSAEDDLDAYAFERRVVIQLEQPPAVAAASGP